MMNTKKVSKEGTGKADSDPPVVPTNTDNVIHEGRELTKHELTMMYLPPKRCHQKRRKKTFGPNDLLPETVPLNDVRRTYPTIFASLTSRAGIDEMRAQFSKIVANDDFTFIIATVEGENPFGPVYRETKGLEASIKFMSAYFQAVPDCIVTHTNLQFFKRKNGHSVLKTDFTIGGCMAFKVVVNNAEQSDDFKSAVEGLQGLQGFQGAVEAESNDQSSDDSELDSVQNTEDDLVSDNHDSVTSPPSKRPRMDANAAIDGINNKLETVEEAVKPEQHPVTILQQEFHEKKRQAQKKKVELGDTEVLIDSDDDESAYRSILITSDSSNYELGQRTEGRSFSTSGRMIFYMNKEKKLTKIDAQYSAKKTLESGKFYPLNDPMGSKEREKLESPATLTFTAIDSAFAEDGAWEESSSENNEESS